MGAWSLSVDELRLCDAEARGGVGADASAGPGDVGTGPGDDLAAVLGADRPASLDAGRGELALPACEAFVAEPVSPRVWCIRDALGVAMYLVVGERRAALVDTGYGIAGLREFVRTVTPLPVTVLLTHGHQDHAMGAFEFGEARLSVHDRRALAHDAEPGYRRAFLGQRFARCGDLRFQAGELHLLPLEDGDKLDLGGVDLAAVAVPGHTAGSMVFLVEKERLALVGDACGPGTLVLEPDAPSMEGYAAALRRLDAMMGEDWRVLRCHGSAESDRGIISRVAGLAELVAADRDERLPVEREFYRRFLLEDDADVFRARAVGDQLGNIVYKRLSCD